MIGKPRAKRPEKPCLQRLDDSGMTITKIKTEREGTFKCTGSFAKTNSHKMEVRRAREDAVQL